MKMFIRPNIINKLIKEKRKGKLVIGIISTHTGAGGTHLSLLLATYLSEWLGQKTAYIEFGDKKGITCLREYFYKDSKEESTHFSVGRVTFYKNPNGRSLPEITCHNTDCIILDLGKDFSKNKGEFLRSDIKIVVSSLTIWKQQELNLFLNAIGDIKTREDWIYIFPFSENKSLKEARRKYHINMLGVPFVPDPFSIPTNVVQFFQKFI